MKKSLAIAASLVVLLLLAGTALLHPMPTPQAQITVTMNPTFYGLAASQSLPVFATVTNDASNEGVVWSVSGASCSGSACGVLSQTTSTSTLYTAPATGGTYVITATSVANSTAFASAQIAVTDLGGVYTYRHNLTSAGVNSHEYMLTPSNVNSTSFGKLFSCGVDESVYASPLWVANVSIAGGVHNIVIVATQNDSVYAFDADGSNGTTCIQYWKASLLGTNYGAASGATPIPPADTGETGDIPTNIGITSTPVIDPSTNMLYVESNTKENGNYFQRLHALNLGTGAENTSWPINITASVSGTGDGSSGGKLPFIPLHENQRPALALVNGSVYMEFGSHGDNSPWHGWVIGYNTSTRALSGAFATTPNSTGGGIWMAGSAPAVDSSNNLYVITSNGTYNGSTEFGDSFLKLSTSSGVALAGSTTAATFTPDDQSSLSSGNLDLGQGGAITLLDSASGPNPHLLIGGGKEGVLYLLNRDNMGGYSASNNNGALQTWSLGSGGSNYAGIAAAGGFWQNTYYIAGSDGAMQAYAFNTTTGLFNTNPTSQSTNTFPFPGASPEISASGTTNAILWALDTSGNGTNGQSTGPAVLYAYEATNLNTQLWNSTQNTPQGGSNQAANAVKFVIPTVANGKVYVVGVNSLTVYGLFSSYKTAVSPTFTPAPGTYTTPVKVTLSDASSGATIYYTTDGSLPTTSSNVYSGSINVSATTTITAMATAPGLGSSPPVSGTYTIGTPTIMYVQGAYATPQSAQTTVPMVFSGAQTLGDLNVVVVGWNDTTAAVSSVKDSSGNAYTLAVGPTVVSGTLSQSIYYAKNIASAGAGANTVTVTFTKAAAYPDIRILEYSGADPNTPVDVTAANTGNSTTSSSGSVTTTNATDLLFGANIVTSVTGGPGTGFTSRLLTSPDGDIAEDEMVTSTGSYSATAPLSFGQWIMQLVAFRAAGSGSGGTLPTVSSVSPNSGPAAGGTPVTISGTNFAAGATVTFGSAAATNVVVTDSTTITATTPAGSAGAVTVTVAVNGQNGSLPNGFTYVVPPTVSSVSPNSGSTSGGTAVTITGTNFVAGATVTFGSAAATNVVVTSSTTITATTPAGTAGATTVTVTVSGQSGSLASGFTYVVGPTVSGVSPATGPGTGGTAVTITGTNFAAGATVTLGSSAATNVVVTNSTTITATTPAGSAGSVTVTVTVNGQSGSLTNGFTYVVAPTVSSVSPNTGPTSGGTAVTITGTNFAAGATVTFGGAAATNVVVTNSTTITAKTPAGSVGAVTVTVTNTGSQSGSLTNGFTYATVTTISYVQGNYATPQTSQTSVPVKFNSAQTLGDLNVVVVGWNDTTAAVSSVADSSGNTYALAVGPNAISGTLSQSIYYAKNIASAGAGANTVTVTFTKAATYPDIRILEYSGADPNTPVDVTAANTGNSTTSSSGSATTTNATDLIFGANIVTSVTGGPGTGFTSRLLTSPDGDIAEDEMVSSTGSYSAAAALSSGQWIMQMVAFRTPSGGPVPPTVSGVSPSSGPAAGGTPVTISGTNFAAGATVTFGSAAATNVVVTDSTTITATTPAGSAGAVTVTVAVNGQNGSLPNGFTYVVPPTVSSVSPNSGSTSGGTAVTITGTNFVAGATVTFGSAAATNVVVTSSTTITATTPAGTAGATTVTVTVSGQSGSLASGFTYVVGPTVSSVSPATGPGTGGTAVTITGTNFAAGATVTLGSSAATNVVVTNSTTITATTPAGSAGSVTVTVTVNGQSGSLTNGFTYVVAPTVSSVSPNTGPTSGGTAVTITGTNFAAGATVTFGGAAATNVVVTNSTTITAKTPAGSVGAVTVTVTNTGSQSGSLTNGFTYATVTTISYVQGNYATPQTSQTSVPVKFNSAQTLGDLNVVVVGWNDTTAAVSSVADSSGNTYALAVGPNAISGTLSQSIYYAKNIASAGAGANTVTVTFTKAATYPDIRILEYSGADPNTPVDVTAANTGNSTTSSSGSATTTNATDLIFGANIVTSVTGGPGTGFTSRLLTSPDGDIAEDEMVSSTGSYSAAAALSSGQWIMQMVAFRTPSGGPVPPTVSGVSPSSGPAAGGTPVTISGTNFAAGATVTFGSAAATNVVVTDSTTITATTPAGSAGAVTVTVAVNGQNGSLPNGFTYVVPPTVSSVSPNSGSTSGGTAVTITGTNFVAGATVTFGSAAATNVVVTSSTTITATTPAGTAGAVTVTVTVSGQSGSLASGFTYVVGPTVSGVSPATGPGAGGTAVTITGTNFAAGATVTFGSASATNVLVTNSTTITATTPAGTAGAVTVTVTVSGQSGSLANAFTYIVPPTVSSVAPNTGSTTGGTAVTIAGTNFAAGATVTLGSSAATNVVVTNSTTITATTPAGSAGAVTVTVTNTGSQSGSLANGFTYASVPTPTAPTNFAASGTGPGPTVANVQSYINSTFLTVHTTAPFDSTGGDVIVICSSSHAGVTLTPSDSFGNTWIPIAGPTNTSVGFDLRTQLWYARNPIVGPNHTVTMTLSAAQSLVISVFVVKGSNASSPIDAISLIGSDNGTQTVNVASPNITTSSANDLLIGFVKVSAGATFTSSTGFTQQPAASSNFLDAETGPAASAGTYDATFTLNTAQTWQSAVAAIYNNPNQALLSWTASTETGGTISQYLVERCQGSGCTSFVQIGTTTGTTFNDTGLTASTSYSYRVRAQDTSGTTGPYSSTASLTTPAPVPSLPGNLVATPTSASQINLSWMASAETGGTINNYLVERCQGAGCTNFAQIVTTAGTTFSDTGLSITSYTYRVRASDTAGHLSPYSNLATAIVGIRYSQGNYATPQSPQTSVSVGFTGSQAAGDLNVVVVGWNDTTASVSSVVDSSGNTYTRAVGPNAVSGTLSQSIYYAKNIVAAGAGANTVTVTFTTAAAYPDIRILEYSGADPNGPVDVTAANTGNSTSSSSGVVTTTNAADLLFGANIVTSVTGGPGTGFTSRLLTSPDGDIAEDEMVSSTGSYSATAPISSGAWIMQLVAFKAAP